MNRFIHPALLLFILLAGCAPAPIPTVPASVTPKASQIPTNTPSPTPTLTLTPTPMALSDRVRAFMTGHIEFPTDLTREQYPAFIKEMNVQRGQQPIWVEAENAKGKVTLYHNVTTNKMETLSGTYQDNKEIIEKNSYQMFAEIYEQEGTGNLQYVHPDTGELMTLRDSANIEWGKIIDKNNLHDGYMKLPTGKALTILEGDVSTSKGYKSNYIQAIVLDESPIILTAAQGRYSDLQCLDTLFMRTDKTGKPIYAIRVFASEIGFFIFMKEGEASVDRLITNRDYEANLKPNQVYFLRVPIDQDYIWRTNLKSTMDQLQNTSSINQSYDNAVNNMIPNDGNIILASSGIIEKK